MRKMLQVLAAGMTVMAVVSPALAQQIAGGTWSSSPGDACAAFANQATNESSCDNGNFYDGKTYTMKGMPYTKVYLNTGRIMFLPADSGAETNSADPGGNRQ